MKMHHTKNSISEEIRTTVANNLNKVLASAIDLQIQLKQAHWNIKGMEFIALHKLFDELHDEVVKHVDDIAERVVSLGGTAEGTVQQVADNSELKKYPADIFSAKEHLENLTHNFAILGEIARQNISSTEKIGDMASNEICVALAKMLDKNLWFLEAHLQG